MMSLSDNQENMDLQNPVSSASVGAAPADDDGFRAIDVNTLDSFKEEVSLKGPDTQPDFDRFKLLFDPEEIKKEEGGFDALYKITKKVKEELFEPLIPGADVETEPLKGSGAGPNDDLADEEAEAEEGPTAEELGFARGYEEGLAKGLEEGKAQGHAKGYEQGLEEGREEGFKQGEADGFAKGEADGLEKGMAEGLEAGRNEVVKEMESILTPFREALGTVDQLMENLLTRYEDQLVGLVFKIAEKAVMARLDTDDSVIKNTIIDALSYLASPEEITLSVSDEDYEYVEMVKETFFESLSSLTRVTVNTDSMIPKGGCRIESAGATIATDPESKLQAVYEAITQVGK